MLLQRNRARHEGYRQAHSDKGRCAGGCSSASGDPETNVCQNCGLQAYILLPCSVGCYELYVKLQLATVGDLMVIVSVHQPEFDSKKGKSHAKRKR
jgi:hypothetical protein